MAAIGRPGLANRAQYDGQPGRHEPAVGVVRAEATGDASSRLDGAGDQPFSTFNDGDTLFAVSTGEIAGATPGLIDLDTIAGETMWDAILASVPKKSTFTPPAIPIAVVPSTLAGYAGNYRFGPHAVITVGAADGKLTATLWGVTFFDLRKDQKTILLPLSNTDFYCNGRYHTRVSFAVDLSGKATGAIVNSGRWQEMGERASD